MNELEKKILENVFDSLDRLFDAKCKAIDVYALIFSSKCALISTSGGTVLSKYIEPLESVVRSVKSDELQRKEALQVTNSLREELNELLPS